MSTIKKFVKKVIVLAGVASVLGGCLCFPAAGGATCVGSIIEGIRLVI